MILVANGGLGSAYDELELNRGICEKYGIKVRGVVLNKVVPDKLEMVTEYFGKLLKSWDVPLLGVVPDEPYLARPSLIDLERIFKTKLLAGLENRRYPHYSIKHTHLAATGAYVAKALNADMILVANGGLGSAYDELELNRGICEKYGIKVRGVVLNKVVPDKLEMVTEYFGKLLKSWDVPLLGVVPDEPYLARPSLIDLERIFKTKLLAGLENRRYPHYSIKHTHLAATGLRVFLEKLECAPPNPLVVTHCTRDDIVLGFLAHAQNCKELGNSFGGALVLTGLDLRPMAYVEDLLKMHDIPVIISNVSTFDTMDSIRSYTPKLHKEDEVRVRLAVSHYEPYIDFDTLLRSTEGSSS
eukprot:g11395.t1